MSEYITHTDSTRRLERTSSRVVAGVAGGLGRYFDLNPAFFRLGFVVLTLLGGAGVLVYLAALLVMPEEGKERSIVEQALAGRRERPLPLIGLGLIGVALAVLLSRSTIWAISGLGWVLVLLAGLAILWTYDSSRGDRRSRLLVRGLVAVAVAGVVAAVAAVVLAFAWFDVSLDDGIGSRVLIPASATELHSSYKLGIGDFRLDLSKVTVARETHVLAKLGIGELRIIVPRGVAVAANAHAKVGEVDVLGRHDDGRNATVRAGAGLLVLDATVGAGRIDVVRASR